MVRLMALVCALSVCSGCATFWPSNPATGVEGDGSRLSVQPETKSVTYSAPVQTIDGYESVVRTTRVRTCCKTYLGLRSIDVQDLYRIVGDRDAYLAIRDARESYISNVRWSTVALAATAVATTVFGAIALSDTDDAVMMQLFSYSGVGMLGATLWGILARKKGSSVPTRVVSRESVERAVDAYNQRLSRRSAEVR